VNKVLRPFFSDAVRGHDRCLRRQDVGPREAEIVTGIKDLGPPSRRPVPTAGDRAEKGEAMKTQVTFSEPLAELCRRTCSRCAPDGGDAVPGSSPVLLDEPEHGSPPALRKRRISLPLPRCERCQFLLLMEAIEHLIPAEAQSDWLKEPNVDLGGLCPAEHIGAGNHEPVFTALFLLDPYGPVS
jgi:hypothetical protein